METMSNQKNYSSNSSLKRNVFLNTFFRILMIVAPLLTAPYVSRVLLSDGVGVYSYTQSLVTYFTMFAALGTVSYGTREIARKREDKNEYSKTFWGIELISVICSIVCITGWLALSFSYQEYRLYLLIFTFSILATTLDISWFYAGLEKYKYTISVNFLFKVLSVVLIFVFVKKPSDIWIYVLIYSASLFLGNGSMWIFLPKFLVKTKIDKRSLKTHFKETLIYFIPTIAASLYTVLDKTLIGALIQGETTVVVDGEEKVKKISELESGYYEQATKIIDLVKTVAFVSINTVIYSRSSYLYKIEDKNAIKRLTLQTFQIVMFLSIASAFGLICISDAFVPVFFGDGYDKTIVLLKIMAFLVPIICLSGTLGSLYYSPVGKRKQSALFLVVGAIINLLISAPLVIFLKSIGAAIASLIAELVISVLYFAYCKRAITFKELFQILWKKVVAGGLMMLVLLLFNKYISGYISNAILFLIVLLIFGFAIYVSILKLLKDDSLKALFGFLKLKKVFNKDYGDKSIKTKKRMTIKRLGLYCLVTISSIGSVACAYLYGSSKTSSKFYSILMSLDAQVKKQENTDFLHGTLQYIGDSKTEADKYNDFLAFQRKTKTKYNYYNSFLVSSFDGNKYIDYDTDFDIADVPLKQSKLIQVATYYDYYYMESIGLPLFKYSSSPSVMTAKNNANFGSYISASYAEEIVSKNGMLEANNYVLEDAFNQLLNDESYVFNIHNDFYKEGQVITFSINNIYIDDDHIDMLGEFQKSVQKTRYGNYSKSFDYWFKNSIFTFSSSIFSEGCSYVFDIRKNYGNSDRFFSNVIGYDYAINDYSVSFLRESGDIYKESAMMNEASADYHQSAKIVYLVFSIVLFVFAAVSYELFGSKFDRQQKCVFVALPAAVFVLFQLVFYLLLGLNSNGFSLFYRFFNSIGNIICLIAIISIIINALVWDYYVRKSER